MLKDYFSSLHDDQLLYLYSIYIGEVPSPFHKPKLIRELLNYFLLPETIRAQVSLLDESDLDILTALRHARNPDTDTLCEVLSCAGYQKHEVLRIIVHLEERLAVIPESLARTVYHMHPGILELIDEELSLRSLFPPSEDIPGTPPPYQITAPAIAAWFSLLRHRPELFTPEGQPRTRRLNEVSQLFPLFRDSETVLKLAGAASSFGAVHAEGGEMSLHEQTLQAVSSMEPARMMFAAACCAVLRQKGQFAPMAKILSLCRLNTFKAAGIQGMLMLLLGISKDEAAAVLERCEYYGVTEVSGPLVRFSPLILRWDENLTNTGSCTCVLSSDLRIHIDGPEYTEGWQSLSRFCVLETFDRVLILRITRESILGALDNGMDIKEILSILAAACGRDIPRPAARIIEDWGSTYQNLSLYQGITLCCDSRIAGIIRRHPKLSSMKYLEPAEGVFLFPARLASHLRETLSESGIPFVPAVDHMSDAAGTALRVLPEIPDISLQNPKPVQRSADPGKVLDQLKHEIPAVTDAGVFHELTYRIEQRMVLSPAQLKSTSRKRTIFEAGGFDYQGKLQLIRQAIANSSDMLELKVQGSNETLMVKPKSLFREGASDILNGYTLPRWEPFTISAAKLLLVRKIRKPLYLPQRDTQNR